ncbi:MAG: transglutaminase domain-containing protein, partial [Spirochaetaceae bacterium]
EGGEFSLLGVDASDWSQGTDGDGEGDDEQRAIMVIASRLDPVYAADGYRDAFDTIRGFTYPERQPLNDLIRTRLAGTWRNPEWVSDSMRREFSVNVYSTIPDRVLPYVPHTAEPTVYQPRYYPFSYSFHGSSRVSVVGRTQLDRARDLSAAERERLAPHLQIELLPDHEAAFRAHIDERIGEIPQGYHARILAIMEAFRTFQYEVGYDDDFSPAHMARFVTDTLSGDCVEFSNTAAILGRMMGIPSRVVTGYLATASLQNPAHERGLAVLRESLPQLSGYRLDEMYLVTTSHRHAWVQFYVPGYGWVDFEPTSYAIPPPPGGDPNERRVVIPIIDPRELPRTAEFPWAQVVSILLWLGGVTVAGLYLLRYGAEIYLTIRSRGTDQAAVRARYRLLLMRLASRGYDLKPASMTAREYAMQFPELAGFADAYTRFRYMPPAVDRNEEISRLLDGYQRANRDGSHARKYSWITRVFSLRGLHYV